MSPRFPPLDGPAILFAHRGASAHAPENTIEAFRLAMRLGATGLESDVWLTEDGVAVLDHDGVVGRLRRRRVREFARLALPSHVPDLSALLEIAGADLDVSLDVGDPDAFEVVLGDVQRLADPRRCWLCSPDLAVLADWRSRDPTIRLVWSTSLSTMNGGPERAIAQARSSGVDAVNLHHREWSAGLVAMAHRFGRRAFGWDAQHQHMIEGLIAKGIDAVYSDHVDRLVDAAAGPAVDPG